MEATQSLGQAGYLDLEFVGKHGTVDLVLKAHGDVVADIETVDAGPFAASRSHAGAGCPQGGTGTAEIESGLRKIVETGLEMIRRRSQQNGVPGGAVHVGETAAVLVPDVAEVAQGVRLVEPSRRMIDPHGVEGLDVRKEIGTIRIAPDDTGAVALDADDTSMLPMADLIFIGKFQLAEKILCHGIFLGSLLHVLDKARPFSFFQFIQKWSI